MKCLFIIISFVIMSGTNSVHRDTLLKIDNNGNVVGLPKEYSPSKFVIEKNYLRIKDKAIFLPKCVNYYFRILEKPDLRLSASWYHSKDVMPYYLNFDISQKDKDYGYRVLIDLETLKLIYVKVSIKQGDTTYDHTIKLDDSCLNEYEKSIKAMKQ